MKGAQDIQIILDLKNRCNILLLVLFYFAVVSCERSKMSCEERIEVVKNNNNAFSEVDSLFRLIVSNDKQQQVSLCFSNNNINLDIIPGSGNIADPKNIYFGKRLSFDSLKIIFKKFDLNYNKADLIKLKILTGKINYSNIRFIPNIREVVAFYNEPSGFTNYYISIYPFSTIANTEIKDLNIIGGEGVLGRMSCKLD